MIIRNMKHTDLERVCEIENKIFTKPWSESDFISSIEDPSGIYLVVEEQENVIAYCGLWGVVGEGQINNVAVTESCRNRGVAKAMLEELIEKGRKQGLEEFTLEVRLSNISAITLYHNLGFQDAGVRKNFYYEPTEDAMIMWLRE